MGMEGATFFFAAHKLTIKKAGKDKYPFKHPKFHTLRNALDGKAPMSIGIYSLASHSPYRWKPELVGLTTPVVMESKDSVVPIPKCHALPLIGTSEPVKQVEALRGSVEGPSAIGLDGPRVQGGISRKGWRVPANLKIEADTVGLRCTRTSTASTLALRWLNLGPTGICRGTQLVPAK